MPTSLLCRHQCGDWGDLCEEDKESNNEGAEIKKILDHIGEPSMPPKISQALDPPLWDTAEAAQIEVFEAGPGWAIEQQIGPNVQFDQSVNW